VSVRLRPGVLIDDAQPSIVNAATAETLMSVTNVQPNVQTLIASTPAKIYTAKSRHFYVVYRGQYGELQVFRTLTLTAARRWHPGTRPAFTPRAAPMPHGCGSPVGPREPYLWSRLCGPGCICGPVCHLGPWCPGRVLAVVRREPASGRGPHGPCRADRAGRADMERTGPVPSGRIRASLAGDIAMAGRTPPAGCTPPGGERG
jgi:hypothetical protein